MADLKKNGLDEQVKKAEESFISEPYQSSKNGGMYDVVAMAPDDDRIDALYVSVMIENLKKLGNLMSFYRAKISVHLLKVRFGKLYYMY